MKSRLGLLLAAILVSTGCSESTAPDPRAALVGEYVLDRVNGNGLPFLAEETESTRIEVLSGTLSMRANGFYYVLVTTRFTSGTNVSTDDNQSIGTFTVSPTGVTFHETQAGPTFEGTLLGDRLTFTFQGIQFEFVKNQGA